MRHLTSVNAHTSKNLRQILCVSWELALTVHAATHLQSHGDLLKHWLFLRFSHIWLCVSSAGVPSVWRCKHPRSTLTAGKGHVWGLLGGTLWQVIPLRFASLEWVNRAALPQETSYFWKFPQFVPNKCSQTHCKCLASSAQDPNNCQNQECGPCAVPATVVLPQALVTST